MAEKANKPEATAGDETPPQRFAGPGSYGCVGGGSAAEKRTWPELVGLTSEEAESKIKLEKPGVNVQILPQDSFVTMDYRLDRVRIFTDPDGKVSRAPTIG